MANRKRRPGGNPARTAAVARRPSPTASRRSAGKPGKAPAAGAAGDSALRIWVADHSRGLVIGLSRQPKLVLPIIIVALVITGLAAPVPVAVAALAIVALFIGWLAFLSWPVLDARNHAVRTLAILIIVGAAVGRAVGAL